MEEAKPIYETATEITSFAGSGRLFLCDDYPCKLCISTSDRPSILFPSVRHGVLWLKADGNSTLQAKVLSTKLPADLKCVEQEIITPLYWTREFVTELIRLLTHLKFWTYPELREKLLATDPKLLINGLMNNQGRYDIDEVNDDGNTQGKILMETRGFFLGKYTSHK